MKTYLVLTAAVLVFASIAYAGTIAVPIFRDGGTAPVLDAQNRYVGSANNGPLAYIGLKNLTHSDLTIALTYNNVAGADRTPVKNTFKLLALQGIGFRPVYDDSTGDEGAGRAVPNMANAGNGNGSLVVNWVGKNSDIVGRYLEIGSPNAAMYTLPAIQNN